MILRARWTGEIPKAGEYLQAPMRSRFAYRVIAVEQLRSLQRLPGYIRLKLEVERISAADVPDGALVYPWKWDARKKAGFACRTP